MRCKDCDVFGCYERGENCSTWTHHEIEWNNIQNTVRRPCYSQTCDCTVCLMEKHRADVINRCNEERYEQTNKFNSVKEYSIEFTFFYDSNRKNKFRKTVTVTGSDSYEAEEKIKRNFPNVTFINISNVTKEENKN